MSAAPTPAQARATQQALDAASVHEPIPVGEATELRGKFGDLVWKVTSGFDLPPEFRDTEPMGGDE